MRMLHIHVSHIYVSVTPLGSLDFDPHCFLFTQSVETYQRIQRLYALFRHTLLILPCQFLFEVLTIMSMCSHSLQVSAKEHWL